MRVDVPERRGQERVTKVIDRGIEILRELRQGVRVSRPLEQDFGASITPVAPSTSIAAGATTSAPPRRGLSGGTPVKRAHQRS